MSDRLIQVILGTSVLMIVAMFIDSGVLFALAMPVLMFAWMYLGALRKGKIGQGYRFSLVSVLVIWLGGFLTMNLMDTSSVPGFYITGFTPATAIMVYVVWMLPLFFGSYLYGKYFETDGMSQEEFNQLKLEFNQGNGRD